MCQNQTTYRFVQVVFLVEAHHFKFLFSGKSSSFAFGWWDNSAT